MFLSLNNTFMQCVAHTYILYYIEWLQATCFIECAIKVLATYIFAGSAMPYPKMENVDAAPVTAGDAISVAMRLEP